MDDLLEALVILRKYTDAKYPTQCEHDVLYVMVDPDEVDPEDVAFLAKRGFEPDTTFEPCFASYRFGSC